MRFRSLRLVFALFLAAWPAVTTGADAWAGAKLSEYLEYLNASGQRIVYTSDLVRDDMLIENEPGPVSGEADLAALLGPFGLSVRVGPGNSLLVVRGAVDGAVASTPKPATPAAPEIPEIIVTSSLHRLEYAGTTTHTYLDRELATRIPTTGEDAVRLTQRLPGTASGGVSTRSHVRGGEVNEVLFLFDGLRLYEPYHLKDFQSIATIVSANVIGGMDFYTGAYPVHFGDRMSGVLSIDIREPEKSVETELGLSFFNATALSAGTFGDEGQGEWLLSARRGNLDLIVDVIDPEFGSPSYNDLFGHLGWDFGPRADLSANLLLSDDKLSLNDVDRGESASADYTNHVGWVKWRARWSERLGSDTILSSSDITNRRRGTLDLPGIVSGSLNEYREFNVVQLRQDWTWVAAEDWMLRFGFDVKDVNAQYRFVSRQTIEAPFDSILDNVPATSRDFELDPSGAQHAAYGELRWRLSERWTADIGLRWDQQTYTTADNDRQFSPRASILYQPSDATEIRLGWGQFYQAQEINELQVADGVDAFFPAQRAEHYVLNVQQAYRSGIDISLTVYQKKFRTLRPRFENVFNALTLLPEIQFDRVILDPVSADAVGVELMVTRGASDEDLLWWLGYTWSETEDHFTDRSTRRSWDQTHTLKAGISWRWGPWGLSAAGEVHTGWPGTSMSGETVVEPDGSSRLDLRVSERNSIRYSAFHSLDIRLSRDFAVRPGELTTFLEISNVLNRSNPCCREYSLADDGSLLGRESDWLPLVPSLGVEWRF